MKITFSDILELVSFFVKGVSVYFKVMFKVYNEIEPSDHKIYRVTGRQ